MKKIYTIIALLILSGIAYAVTQFPDTVYFNSQIFVPRLANDPTSASANAGTIFFNRTQQKFKGDNGTIIVELSSAGGSSGGSTPHNLLSATHSDTTGSGTDTAILRYRSGTNKWQPLAKGTALQMLTMNGTASDLLYRDLLGTANQVIVTQNPGNITLSLPQSVNTTNSPTFNNLFLNGALTVANDVISGHNVASSNSLTTEGFGQFGTSVSIGSSLTVGTTIGATGNITSNQSIQATTYMNSPDYRVSNTPGITANIVVNGPSTCTTTLNFQAGILTGTSAVC